MFKKKKYEKSELAKKYKIRISTPNGYFPEDVDKILVKFEKENEVLAKDNTAMTKQLSELEKKYEDLKGEYASLQMTVSLMQVPATTSSQDEKMLEKITTIKDNRKKKEKEKVQDFNFDNYKEEEFEILEM